MPVLESTLEQRFQQHVEQDFEQFQSIRLSLEKINDKLDIIGERSVRLETWQEVMQREASRSGALAGSKWAALIGVIIAGVANACGYITGG